MGKIEKTVFVSYRRKHIVWALAVSQYLIHRGYDVFFDYTNIGAGDFGQIISENIKARAHFLVLLAPSSLEGFDREEDWLRKEIEWAIETKRNIIPIMLEGFDFGSPVTKKYLTGSLEPLSHYNGINLPAEYFDVGMERLCNYFLNVSLEEVLITVSQKVQNEIEEQKVAIASAEPVSEKKLTAREWFERAYQSRELEEKIRLYTKAINLDPQFSEAYINRGNCYESMKRYERAIIDYTEAIRLNPNDATSYNNLGLCYANLRQYEEAIANYNEALRCKPLFVAAFINRGSSYGEMEQYERAIADYNEALRLDPKKATAYYNRGKCYANLKQYERAIADYNEANRLDPENISILHKRESVLIYKNILDKNNID